MGSLRIMGDANPKAAKTDNAAIFTLSLAPADTAGAVLRMLLDSGMSADDIASRFARRFRELHSPEWWATAIHKHARNPKTVCALAGACRDTCLSSAGRGRGTGPNGSIRANIGNIMLGRIARTLLFWEDRATFLDWTSRDLRTLQHRARRLGVTGAARLNTLSDIVWERVAPELFAWYPDIVFYDYTKIPVRFRRNRPNNYSLTYSYSEKTTGRDIADLAAESTNIAAVFAGEFPAEFLGRPILDGTGGDARWRDPLGYVVALKPLGALKNSRSDFLAA